MSANAIRNYKRCPNCENLNKPNAAKCIVCSTILLRIPNYPEDAFRKYEIEELNIRNIAAESQKTAHVKNILTNTKKEIVFIDFDSLNHKISQEFDVHLNNFMLMDKHGVTLTKNNFNPNNISDTVIALIIKNVSGGFRKKVSRKKASRKTVPNVPKKVSRKKVSRKKASRKTVSRKKVSRK